jgi:hypothetical protein
MLLLLMRSFQGEISFAVRLANHHSANLRGAGVDGGMQHTAAGGETCGEMHNTAAGSLAGPLEAPIRRKWTSGSLHTQHLFLNNKTSYVPCYIATGPGGHNRATSTSAGPPEAASVWRKWTTGSLYTQQLSLKTETCYVPCYFPSRSRRL